MKCKTSEDIKRAYAAYNLLDKEQKKGACEIAKKYLYSIKRAYAAYNLLDKEQKKEACEIAEKYPCSTEHVAEVILEHGFSKEEAERYIRWELVMYRM